MPSAISRLPSGKYRVLLRDGRRYIGSRTFKTRSVAEEWARQQDAEIDRIGAGLVRAHHVTETVGELLDEYLASAPSPAYLVKSPRAMLGALRYGALTPDAVSAWIARRGRETARNTGKRISSDTVRRELAALGSFLRWCYRVKRLPPHAQHPTHGVEVPKPAPGRDRRLTDDERRKMAEALTDAPRATVGPQRSGNYRTGTRNPFVLPLMQFAAETGMRRTEICLMLWSWIDLDAKVPAVSIPAEVTKTRRAREVPLTSVAEAIVRALPRPAADEADQRVFPIRAENATRSIGRARQRAGVADVRLHDMRHEAISHLIELDMSVPDAMAIAGHSNRDSSARYINLDTQHLGEKLRRKEAAASSTAEPARLNNGSKFKSAALEALHASASAMYKAGAIDEAAMRHFDAVCLATDQTKKPG